MVELNRSELNKPILNNSDEQTVGLEQPFHRIAVFAETERYGPPILEMAFRCLGAGAANGQPDRGAYSPLGALVPPATKIVAEVAKLLKRSGASRVDVRALTCTPEERR